MQECVFSALLVIRDWAKKIFVVPGVDFEIIVVGSLETSSLHRTYFKIQYADGEINEGDLFEALCDKTTGKTSFAAFQDTGFARATQK